MKKAWMFKTCQYCGEFYEAKRREQKYCSKKCGHLGYLRKCFYDSKATGRWEDLKNVNWEEYHKASVERSRKSTMVATFLREFVYAIRLDNEKTPRKELHLKIKTLFYGQ